MATGNVNNKSQMKNIRFPHDVLEGIDAMKRDDETTASFVVAAVRSEIVRRQTDGATENPLLSSLNTLEQVEAIGTSAGEEIKRLVDVARSEIRRRKPKDME
ncbi:TPA: hypothetical protein OEJ39_002017 [Escherichia coli]|nr:hypothetical protein [Escherichia coli]